MALFYSWKVDFEALAFILKDHKTKPEIDKLMTITPVGNNCDPPSKNWL